MSVYRFLLNHVKEQVYCAQKSDIVSCFIVIIIAVIGKIIQLSFTIGDLGKGLVAKGS